MAKFLIYITDDKTSLVGYVKDIQQLHTYLDTRARTIGYDSEIFYTKDVTHAKVFHFENRYLAIGYCTFINEQCTGLSFTPRTTTRDENKNEINGKQLGPKGDNGEAPEANELSGRG